MSVTSTEDKFESSVVRKRVARMIGEATIEEYVGEKYSRDITECLDILDMEYVVTAVGLLGRALEECIKEYSCIKLKNKKEFSVNDNNYSIAQIRKYLYHKNTSHDTRVKLLHQEEIVIKSGKKLKLKRKILADNKYNLLMDIKDGRNKAFHGCSESDYIELSARGGSMIEQGIILLVGLVTEINN